MKKPAKFLAVDSCGDVWRAFAQLFPCGENCGQIARSFGAGTVLSELFHGGDDFRIDADTGVDDEASFRCMSNADSTAGSTAQQTCDVPRGIYGVAGNGQRTCQDVGVAGGNCCDGSRSVAGSAENGLEFMSPLTISLMVPSPPRGK